MRTYTKDDDSTPFIVFRRRCLELNDREMASLERAQKILWAIRQRLEAEGIDENDSLAQQYARAETTLGEVAETRLFILKTERL